MTRDALVASLVRIVGDKHVVADARDMAAFLAEPRDLFHGVAACVVRPGSTDEVSAILRLCHETGTPVVPQGGNTGLVGGQVPDASGAAVILSLTRMDRLREVDLASNVMIVEAGMTLLAAQAHAEKVDRLFPLSLASEGSCTIGGNLSTNAGGVAVLAYGNARELALGLEVVLADGRVLHGLSRLKKDNTGYDLKHLFMGAEGTLGVITAAVLKLFPRPREVEVALCAVASPQAALQLFQACQQHDAAAIHAFEYMSGAGMALVERFIPDAKPPLAAPAAHYVLLELATPRQGAGLRAALEELLGRAMEQGIVADAVIAESGGQRAAIWKLREEHSEAQKRAGASVKNDISVPVSRVPALIRRATTACEALVPGIRCVPFGHLGDGNIHFNLVQPEGADGAAFMARDHELMDAVNDIVRDLDGSFSAEHGIGRLKPYMMPDWRGGAELDLMRRIKTALDPAGLLNPGKMLP